MEWDVLFLAESGAYIVITHVSMDVNTYYCSPIFACFQNKAEGFQHYAVLQCAFYDGQTHTFLLGLVSAPDTNEYLNIGKPIILNSIVTIDHYCALQ